MTIQEFHTNFDIELDKTLDFEYPYILAEQKDYWLNKAQDEFINDIIDPKPNKKGFEETQNRIDDLRTIVKPSGNLTATADGTKYSVTLPEDYLHKVRHVCNTVSSCGSKIVGGEQVTQFFLNNMLNNPFWKPTADNPLYYFIGNKIEYETLGDFTIVNANITYVKKPAKLRLGTAYINPVSNIECELPEHTHIKILAKAIAMILENIESQRYQTNLNELNKIE